MLQCGRRLRLHRRCQHQRQVSCQQRKVTAQPRHQMLARTPDTTLTGTATQLTTMGSAVGMVAIAAKAHARAPTRTPAAPTVTTAKIPPKVTVPPTNQQQNQRSDQLGQVKPRPLLQRLRKGLRASARIRRITQTATATLQTTWCYVDMTAVTAAQALAFQLQAGLAAKMASTVLIRMQRLANRSPRPPPSQRPHRLRRRRLLHP